MSTERMLGTDALLWHMERPDTPLHTLKTVVLDTSGREGGPLALEDLQLAIERRLGLLPRWTQRVEAAPGFPGRPFWVDDPDFDLDDHVEEVTLPAPGARAALDELHGRLAASNLDVDRPLWKATLVHGLERGRQAVVVQLHHAITDGIGALNTMLLFTGATPEEPGPMRPRLDPSPPPTPQALRRRVVSDTGGHLARLGSLLVAAGRSARRARAYRREHPELPAFIGARRNFTNRSTGASHVCASGDVDFDRVRGVAKAAEVTVNGVYHALIAAALRDELLRRGEDLTRPTAAAFGIAIPNAPADRVQGNFITPTAVSVFSNLDDPVQRLRQTALSCREGVDLRRSTGLEMTLRWSEYTCRFAAWFLRKVGARSPIVVNHVTTANVPGPPERRYLGAIEVVDWISFAIAYSPANLNVTAYSYAGRLSIGVLATGGVLPEPRRFLGRMQEELDVLHDLLCDRE